MAALAFFTFTLLSASESQPAVHPRLHWTVVYQTVTVQKRGVVVKEEQGDVPLRSKQWRCRYQMKSSRGDEGDAGYEHLRLTCSQEPKGSEVSMGLECYPGKTAYDDTSMVIVERPLLQGRARRRHLLLIVCSARPAS